MARFGFGVPLNLAHPSLCSEPIANRLFTGAHSFVGRADGSKLFSDPPDEHSRELISRMTLRKSALIWFFFLCLSAFAQVTPGTPSFSTYDTDPSGYTTINLQNLNVAMNVPMFNKPGAIPFELALTGANSYVYGSSTLEPGYPKVPLVGVVNGVVGYPYYYVMAFPGVTYTGVLCPSQYGSGLAEQYGSWYLQMADGTQHPLPTTDYSYHGSSCSSSFTATTLDGSGYTVSITGDTVNSIYSSDGSSISSTAITDPNGNTITWNGNTTYTDTMGLVALTSGTCTNGACPYWSWSDVAGGSPTSTITYNSGAITVRSAFGCSSKTDYDYTDSLPYIPNEISFPDGSSLALAWEPTPGYPSDTTARLQTVTLRDGVSKVSFNYNPQNATNDGINCTYLIPNSITRTTSDGTRAYTWAHTATGNTTTMVNEGGNKTVYTFTSGTFGSPFLSGVQYYPNTGTVATPAYGSTPARQDIYCYNAASGQPGNCLTSSTVGIPITEIDVYTTLGGMSASSRQQTQFDSYGNVTYSAEYDFGATTPTVATTTVYAINGSGNCSGIGGNIHNKPCSIVTSEFGNTVASSQFAYSSTGNLLTTSVSPNGGALFLSNTTANTYNANGTPSATYDLANNKTTYTYSSAGYVGCSGVPACTNFPFPTAIAYANGTTENKTWNAVGGVMLTDVDVNDNTTTLGYTDYWNRLTSVQDPLGNIIYDTYSATTVDSSFTFNSGGSVQNVEITFDGYHRPVNLQKQQGPSVTKYDTVSKAYNFSGVNPTVYSSLPCAEPLATPCGGTNGVTATVDIFGRTISSVDGDGGTDTVTYSENDVLSVLGPAPSFDGENTKQVQKEYNGLGWFTKSCMIGNGSATACGQNTGGSNGVTDTYTYSSPAAGETEISVQRGTGGQSRAAYSDGLGRVIEKITPEGGTWNYYYDTFTTPSCPTGYKGAPGLLGAAKDPDGNLLCYAYDSMNRLTGVNANGTSCRHFVFDTSYGTLPTGVSAPTYTNGRLAEAWTDNCSGTLITDEWFSYDKDGRVTIQYQHTPNSGTYYKAVATFTGPALTAVQLANPSLYTISYGLDGEGRANNISKGSTVEASIPSTGFNPAGLPLTINIGPGTDYDSYTYDPGTDRMTGWTFQAGSTAGSNQETGALTWNPIGTLKTVAITDEFHAGNTMTCNFGTSGNMGYDDWNRLVYDDCGSGNWGQAFSYDMYNNLTKSVIPGRTGVTWAPTYSSTTNQIAANTYDSNGNTLIDYLAHNYAWSPFGQMQSVDISGANCATSGECLIRDAFGRIVEIGTAGSATEWWYTQLGKSVNMSASTENDSYWPGPGGGTLFHNSGWYWMHKDWLGSARVVSLATSLSTISSDKSFAPYGEVINSYGETALQDLNFTGDNQDVVAGVYNTPNRELAASNQGRWLSPDPSGAGWNQYAYCPDPNGCTDPSGMWQKGYPYRTPARGGGCGLGAETNPCGDPNDPNNNPVFIVDGFEEPASMALGILSIGSGGGPLIFPQTHNQITGFGLEEYENIMSYYDDSTGTYETDWGPDGPFGTRLDIYMSTVTNSLTMWVAANNGNFSWWGAFAKNLFSWKNFTNEFKQGGCVNVAVNATAGALNPFSPSLATAGEATAGVLAASQYNAAVAYAASAPNYLGGTGLIYPMKSSVVRGMIADANATAAEAPLFAVDGTLLQGVIAEGISMANGECH
jgi:RHS repeat-associated protein